MSCPLDTFQCQSGCISWDYVCDGIIQCQNGEDESICGKCVKNTFQCIDGTEISCELSCTILGFIPCSRYRNRATCLHEYPYALGSNYKNSYKLAQSTLTKSNAFFSNSNFYYVLVSIIIFVLLIVGFILCIIIYKKLFTSKHGFTKKKPSAISKPTNKRKSSNRSQGAEFNNNNRLIDKKPQKESIKRIKFAPSLPSVTSSSESINKLEFKKESNDIINDDDHKYHEIADFSSSIENNVSIINNDEMPQTLLIQNDNNYYTTKNESDNFEIKNEILPPPYNKIHMFKNAGRNSLHKKTYIHGKSTYV